MPSGDHLPNMNARTRLGRRLLRVGAVLLVALLLIMFRVGPAPSAARFADVPSDHPYRSAIEDLADRGIVSGYADGSFHPGEIVKRMQFAKMIVLAVGFAVTEQDSDSFQDVPRGSGLYPYHFVAVAANNGLMTGYDSDSFGPLDQITRMQLITTITRATGSLLMQPPDDWQGLVESSDPSHGENIRWAEYNGLLTGIKDLANWDTRNGATRGEVAQVLHNGLAKTAYRLPLSVSNYGAQGDGVSDDSQAIQKAIDACPAGGTVALPAGTYAISAPLGLKSRVSLQGAGVDQTVLTMPAQTSRQYMLYAENVSDLTLSDLTLRAGGYRDNVSGLSLPGAQNCKAINLHFEGLVYGMKLGSGSVASGWEISDIVIRDTEMPMYVSYVHDSSFTRLDLQAVHLATTGDHAMYLERENRRLTFNDCALYGGSGYCLQLYLETGSSSDISFNNLLLDATTGRYPLMIGAGFSDVSFTNSTFVAGSDSGVIRFYGGSNVAFDGFAAYGGTVLALVAGSVDNVVLRNGNYTGSDLGSGVTFENVTANSKTVTTDATANTTTTP